ncbi:hypothetical protein AB0D91_20520 [Streptomyces canus]
MIAPIPPVLPAGRMADNAERVLALPGGLELRPWRTPLLGAVRAVAWEG